MKTPTMFDAYNHANETVEIDPDWSDRFSYRTFTTPVATSVWSAECQFGRNTFERGRWQAISKTKEGATKAIVKYLRACKENHLAHPSDPNPSDWLRVEIEQTRLLD